MFNNIQSSLASALKQGNIIALGTNNTVLLQVQGKPFTGADSSVLLIPVCSVKASYQGGNWNFVVKDETLQIATFKLTDSVYIIQ